MKRLFKRFGVSLAIVCLMTMPLTLSAASKAAQKATKGVDTAGVKTGLTETAPETTVILIIQTILGIAGVILVILMIYGGVMWMTARGNEEQVKKARAILTNAVIGMVITFMAYGISSFVFRAIDVADVTVSDDSDLEDPYLIDDGL